MVTAVHLAVSPAPPLRRVVQVTDLLRAAALARLPGPVTYPSVLSGHQAPGEPFRDGMHGHAHWLPVTDGAQLLGVCVWAPAGFTAAETLAVASVRRCGSDPPPAGHVRAFTVTPVPGDMPPPFSSAATEWRSVTPYLGTLRHDRPSRRTPEFFHAMIAADFAARGLPSVTAVEVLPEPVTGWQTRRPSRPEWVPPPVMIRVVTAAPAKGPVTIGRLSHFGFGVLAPARR